MTKVMLRSHFADPSTTSTSLSNTQEYFTPLSIKNKFSTFARILTIEKTHAIENSSLHIGL